MCTPGRGRFEICAPDAWDLASVSLFIDAGIYRGAAGIWVRDYYACRLVHVLHVYARLSWKGFRVAACILPDKIYCLCVSIHAAERRFG